MGPIILICIGAGVAHALNHGRAASAYRAGVRDSLDTAAATAEGARLAQGYALSLDPVQAIAQVTDQSLALAEVSRASMHELDRRASALPLFSRISGMGAALPPSMVARAIVTFSDSARRISPPQHLELRAVNSLPRLTAKRRRWLAEYRAARPAQQWEMVEATVEDRDARRNIRLRGWILERLAILEGAARARLERENLPPQIERGTRQMLARIGQYFASVSGTSWPADDATIHAELLEIAKRIAPPGVEVPRGMRAAEGPQRLLPVQQMVRRSAQRDRAERLADRRERRARRAKRRKRARTVATAFLTAANPVAGGAAIAAQAIARARKKRRAERAERRERRAERRERRADRRAADARRDSGLTRLITTATPVGAIRNAVRARRRKRAARARARAAMGALLIPQSFGAGFV